MRRRLLTVVMGNVQGVGLRWMIRQQAQILGLVGTVRNEPDGSVRVEAEGEEGSLRTFVEWLGKQPEGIGIVRTENRWSTPQNLFTSFSILR